MDHLSAPTETLQERFMELAEHIHAPYLTEERKQAISRELARIGFELDSREQEARVTQ